MFVFSLRQAGRRGPMWVWAPGLSPLADLALVLRQFYRVLFPVMLFVSLQNGRIPSAMSGLHVLHLFRGFFLLIFSGLVWMMIVITGFGLYNHHHCFADFYFLASFYSSLISEHSNVLADACPEVSGMGEACCSTSSKLWLK